MPEIASQLAPRHDHARGGHVADHERPDGPLARASGLVDTVAGDKRVAKFVETAEQVSGVVVETVQARVVKPVQDLTGLGKPAAKPARKPAASSSAKASTTKASTTKPASTRPAPKPTAAKTATKSTARKAPAKKATAASKA